MTVKEAIEQLSKLPPDAQLVLEREAYEQYAEVKTFRLDDEAIPEFGIRSPYVFCSIW